MMPRVKICGITNIEDAALAIDLGAGLLGFVLAPSPRRVEPARVRFILDRLKAEGRLDGIETVGVFVNETPANMERILASTGLSIAQIHGDESPEDCASFAFPWFRAIRIGCRSDGSGEGQNPTSFDEWSCPRILLDAGVKGSYGGTGATIARDAALQAGAALRRSAVKKEFFLAGGIGPDTVLESVEALEPDGIDLSSAVEETPGRKSPDKLARLFELLRLTPGRIE